MSAAGSSDHAAAGPPGNGGHEIFSIEQLEAHAAELARIHGATTLEGRPRPLLASFRQTRAALEAHYRVLAARPRGKSEPTPAEEWLLDNSHVIDDQIREIGEDLPQGYLEKLPRLTSGDLEGYPRVYAIAVDFIRHTDGRLELETIVRYVTAYQTVAPLKIGELWALPIMLRLGLIERVQRLADQEISAAAERDRADAWVERILQPGGRRSTQLAVAAADLAKSDAPFASPFVVQLLRRLREHDFAAALHWVHERCAEMDLTPEEMTRLERLRQAGSQVSIGNAITGMRVIAALEWGAFFERTSVVERALREDPSGAYAATEAKSRDRYRHAVEDLAARSFTDEESVARSAVTLAAAHERGAERHVGYYLVDDGRRQLERQIGYRTPIGEALRGALTRNATLFYLGSIVLLAAAMIAPLVIFVESQEALPRLALGAFALLLIAPCTEIAVTFVNWFVTLVLPPRLLARFSFEEGIPEEHRTLVVVPGMLGRREDLANLLEDLEVRSLANPDDNLYFALLTDFRDAPTEERPEDAALLEAAVKGIEALNGRDPKGRIHRFALLHRRRLWNPSEGCWMGWERKRGKLEELGRVLRGREDTSFSVITADLALLRSCRYVLTLDADTQLPREVARRLVSAMAHPLNQPQLDPTGKRVVRGYGLIQPRVATALPSSGRSIFARAHAGRAGIDPYTTAVSDAYQDLFAEGVYIGKALYHVEAFESALADRVPENRLLSHDLFEGLHARAALMTDVEVLDDQPYSYVVAADRQHRWVRGDWQMLSWLLPFVPTRSGQRRKNDLPLVGRWKIFDNLRRSLLAPSIVALLVVGWLCMPHTAGWWTGLALMALGTPLLAQLATTLARPDERMLSRSFMGALWGDFRANATQLAFAMTFLVDRAALMIDAIARTLYRLAAGRSLLEWVTASDAERRSAKRSGPPRRMYAGSAAALGLAGIVTVLAPAALPAALPFLVAWAAAPWIAVWVSKPQKVTERALSTGHRTLLRRTARKTWRFFETFVTAEDHWLPPDNYQEDPKGVLARRTSPTNIGLYLLSTVAARDFGYITLRETHERLENTLGTLAKLELHEGHVLNWYDTATLAPLPPRYVSTVDSGNLAAHLWTVAEACAELGAEPIVKPELLDAASDAIALFQQAITAAKVKLDFDVDGLSLAIEAARSEPPQDAAAWLSTLTALAHRTEPGAVWASSQEPPVHSALESAVYWITCLERGLSGAAAELAELAPWTEKLDEAPRALAEGPCAELWEAWRKELMAVPSPQRLSALADGASARVSAIDAALGTSKLGASDVAYARAWIDKLGAHVYRAGGRADATLARLSAIARDAEARVEAMRFGMLFDAERKLFSIGYDVTAGRLDRSYYDLLASEARLASLVAIAKGDVQQEHWFRLGRQLTSAADRRSLLSWSGSMFEYLMPLIVTKSYEGTLLHETYDAVIRRQREYGSQHGVPWGISESAYNLLDLGLTYQYRAFGVPGLGLKPGLGDDLVVAPYATVLGAMVDPELASKNLVALAKEGLDGPYGYYESIDYTPKHVPPGKRGVVVKVFMAHHQGMSLTVLANVLLNDPFQRRFHAAPRIKATELLLQERVPVVVSLSEPRAAGVVASAATPDGVDSVDHVTTPEGPPRVHLLAGGDVAIMLTAAGNGWMTWKGLDVTRFRDDASVAAWGSALYVRDLDAGDFWSAAYLPTRKKPDSYSVAFSVDRVTYNRRDGDIETVTEVVVTPEHPAEVRRVTITNHGAEPKRIELTTYAEVALAPRGADVAHPVFSNLFVDTEAVEGRDAILARRRPRGPKDPTPWLAHVMSVEEGDAGALEFETNRVRFLGRGRTTAAPLSLEQGAALSGTTGTVLDPIVSLRRVLTIPPHGKARVAFTTAVAASRDAALALVETFHDAHAVPRAFELAWTDARVELRHLGITAVQAQRFQALASAIVYPGDALRAPAEMIAKNLRGREALWRYGISGDLPILLVRLDDAEPRDLVREVLQAHEFWRINGLAVDLVLLDEEPASYLSPVQEQTLAILRASSAQVHIDHPGGVFLRRADQMPEHDRALLQSIARVVLVSSRGSLARQLRRPLQPRSAAQEALAPVARREPPVDKPLERPRLLFWNGIGGFSPDGREYVILLDGKSPTPAPWCNVVAGPRFGFLVSERGAGFTWNDNSQTHRLTPWSNDPVSDPSGEVIYLRDEEDGAVWSATPEPAGRGSAYLVRHGQGYSTFEHTRGALAHALTVLAAPTDAAKIWRLTLTNNGARPRKLSVVGYVEWILGSVRDAGSLIVTESELADSTILARNPSSRFPGRVAFFAASEEVRSMTADRQAFLGRVGSREKPAGLSRTLLAGRVGGGMDPCAAIQVAVSLAPGETKEIVFTLGEGETREAAMALARQYRTPARAAETLREVGKLWDDLLGAVQVRTPDPAFDVLVNRWLLYQAVCCRIWARSAFYQSGGAYGFRDQLQDVLSVVHAAPEIAREQIVRAAARQFPEGDVQHWWHPESGQGVRTRYCDDLVWLPYVVARYVEATGDVAILDESVPFLSGRPLEADEHEIFGVAHASSESGTIYEHCARALQRASTSGPHGLPLMGGGDWNDGMNRVGEKGTGESVWMAWFLGATLHAFQGVAAARGDRVRADRWANEVTRLGQALDEHAWDGAWYRRAYFDDGTPLGSKESDECSIDAIAQSWAVIAGFGDPARAKRALRSTDEKLVKPDEGMILLFTPPFSRTEHDPGYIKAYPPGLRENGGQYTHGVLWTVLAHAMLGDGDRAGALWSMLAPIKHAATPEQVAKYCVEPYVVAADVYAAEGHEGRGGWTWYTGSASWMYRIAVEAMLGVTRRGATLEIAPAIPSSWTRYEVTYRFGGSRYRIVVDNPDHRCGGVISVDVDGTSIRGGTIPLVDDGREHLVRVVLGVEKRLAPRSSLPAIEAGEGRVPR